jgi:hypothetical protein
MGCSTIYRPQKIDVKHICENMPKVWQTIAKWDFSDSSIAWKNDKLGVELPDTELLKAPGLRGS